jgi:glycosyltransferase involved in cell wall biosynthesis
LVDCIVANSHAVGRFAEAQEGLDANRIRVIHNGIDAGRFMPREAYQHIRARLQIPAGRRVVGMVANFSPVKDHALFLSTAGILTHRRDNLHFLLVGDGPLRGEISRAIGKSDRFTVTSTRDDVASLISIMDICVLTSRREGFPNVLLEAMALGRPVVAASVGGVPELVDDGVTGLLAHTRRPEEFADAIDRLLNDDAMAQSLGMRAADRVRKEFSTQRMVEAYRTLYAELLARNSCLKPCAASAE